MNSFQQAKEWLGLCRHQVSVGITFDRGCLVIAVVRESPLRLVGLARRSIVDGSVVDGDIRLPQQLIGTMTEMLDELRLQPGTPAAVSLPPLHDNVQVSSYRGPEPTVVVNERRLDRILSVVLVTSLKLTRVDVTPAALARIALLEHPGSVAVRTANGWSIAAGQDVLDATKRPNSMVTSLRTGPDLGRTVARSQLKSVAMTADIRAGFQMDHDSEALGAALALFGYPPLVTAAPMAPPRHTTSWGIEAVRDEHRSAPPSTVEHSTAGHSTAGHSTVEPTVTVRPAGIARPTAAVGPTAADGGHATKTAGPPGLPPVQLLR